MGRITADPAWEPGFDLLIDYSRAESIVADTKLAREAARQTEARAALLGSGRLAFVAGQEVMFGIGRMYQALAEGSSLEVRVFRELALAERWLERESV